CYLVHRPNPPPTPGSHGRGGTPHARAAGALPVGARAAAAGGEEGHERSDPVPVRRVQRASRRVVRGRARARLPRLLGCGRARHLRPGGAQAELARVRAPARAGRAPRARPVAPRRPGRRRDEGPAGAAETRSRLACWTNASELVTRAGPCYGSAST